MSLCVLTGGKIITLAVSTFTLSWTHSVEKTEWHETWSVGEKGLQVVEASVKGSGAGMEPGQDARLIDGWWVWHPQTSPQKRIALAASGVTPGGWMLCHASGCMELGRQKDEIALSDCSGR